MNRYEIVLSVCETGNVSKTATKLNYSQSAVSQAIKSFEKELGLTVFKRSKYGMELMPNTEEIIESLQNIRDEERKIRRIAEKLTSLDSGYIRIGTIQSIAYHWLPEALDKFCDIYPNIKFKLIVGGFNELKNQLFQGKLDCIFVSYYSVPELEFIPVEKDELMLVTPRGHILSEKLVLSIDDVNGEDFILSADGLDYETGKIFELNNINPRIKYQLNEDFATLKMVETGFGITILPKLLLKNNPFDVCIRSFSEHYSRILGVAYSNKDDISLATIRFLDYLKVYVDKNHDSSQLPERATSVF